MASLVDGAHTITIDMSSGNDPKLSLTITGSKAEPEAEPGYKPMAPLDAAGTKVTAAKTNNPLFLDGKEMVFPAVKIKDWNWIKLRDFAMVLNGGKKQFSLSYDEATRIIDIKTGGSYTPQGGELEELADVDSAISSPQGLRVDGQFIDIAAYNIKGYNYFRLRDLAIILNFNLDYDEETQEITVDLDNPYKE
jgi:hypothetical protein